MDGRVQIGGVWCGWEVQIGGVWCGWEGADRKGVVVGGWKGADRRGVVWVRSGTYISAPQFWLPLSIPSVCTCAGHHHQPPPHRPLAARVWLLPCHL